MFRALAAFCYELLNARPTGAFAPRVRVMPCLVLVHGAVTGVDVWDAVLPYLGSFEVRVPERPRTGSLAREVAWLASVAADCWVVGLSGGATLGLALAATDVPLAGAVLHEPAVGSLAPGLLRPVASAFAASGVAGLGSTLYGPSWNPSVCPPPAGAAAGAELAMFRSFEPAPLSPAAGRVVVTYGGASPAVRRTAAEALLPLGASVQPIPGVGHFAPYDHPAAFAATIADVIRAGRPPVPGV
jgi:pimeloyl-ACP methyl ester carboxylesterase